MSPDYAAQADYIKTLIAHGLLEKVKACLLALTSLTKAQGQ